MAQNTKLSFNYIKKPNDIYSASFNAIKDDADFSKIPVDMHPIALRLIHATANPDIINNLVFSNNAMELGSTALKDGANILCDAEMVVHGITKRFLPNNNKVICTLNDERTTDIAKQLDNTRSFASVELWQQHIGGSIVAIGNAPTALFNLLEKIHNDGWEKPAIILGFPIGYIGAKESKDALIKYAGDIPFITLTGKLGGSAMASGAVNALIGCNNGNYNV